MPPTAPREQTVPLEADVQPEEPEEMKPAEEEFKAVRPEDDGDKVLKPLFDFKKVYKRLQSDIVEKDPQTAKRLLLGLHERFYRCPIGDFKNVLLRAGDSSDTLPLAEEAIMSCSICRKCVRMLDHSINVCRSTCSSAKRFGFCSGLARPPGARWQLQSRAKNMCVF